MAIKSGSILHDIDGFVIDRIQTGGVSNLNIPLEKIKELGNWQTVATIRDIPDLSFDLDSLDVSTEIEAALLRIDPTTTTDGQEFDFNLAVPVDVISPFKSGQSLFTISSGIGLPYLTLESASYKFGVKANASQSFTLRGDAIYYIPGSPYYQQFALSGVGPYTLAHTALPYVEAGTTIYALGVCWTHVSTGQYRRLFHGADYTDTGTTVTLTAGAAALIPSGSIISVVYGSATVATYNQSVHQDSSVKPAAVRGKDIDIYIGYGATPVMTRWTGVQSFQADWKVSLDADSEFGNHHYVAQDYDVPDVTGNIVVRGRDAADLFAKIQTITNTSSSEISGALSSQPVVMEARIYDPNALTPTVLKTIYVPDARFTPPSIQGRVGQKLDTTFAFTSDGGTMKVYKGARP